MTNQMFRSLLLAAPALLGSVIVGAPAIAAETQTETQAIASNAPAAIESSSAVALNLEAPVLTAEASVDPAIAPATTTLTLDAPAPVAAPSIVAQAAPTVIAPSAAPVTTPAANDVNLINQLNQYSQEGQNDVPAGQVTSVNQLSDVRPTDWAYEALSRLIENYGCIAGYPDGTYRGNRALTRYEFAAGLNACLDAIAERVGGVSEEDLAELRRLVDEFRGELATIRGIVDNLEARVTELEENQFSTTTKLVGETIFAFSDLFGGDNITPDDGNNFVFQSRVRLNFDTSFYGTDRLRARLQAGNFERFTALNPAATALNPDPIGGSASEFRNAFDTNTSSNNFQLDTLNYRFTLGGRLTATLAANGTAIDDIVNTISPLDSSGRAAISRFGQRNAIYRLPGQGAGFGLSYRFTNPVLTRNILTLQGGYLAGEASDPAIGQGLFNGDYNAFVQLTGTRFLGERLDFGLTYVHTYNDTSLDTGTGSTRAAFNVANADAVIGNSYGVQLNFRISPQLQIGGWAGYTFARALGTGDGEIFNWAVTLAMPDLGGDGNLLGVIVGMQPRLQSLDSTVRLASSVAGTDDNDTGLHVEAFYRYALTDNIDITPGVIWLTQPNHRDGTDDVIVGTIRTTFRF